MLKRISLFMGIVVLILLVSIVFAEVPKKINYQGRLLESGNPVTGTRDITFKIYKGPTEAWSEFHDDVSITDGVFSAILDLSGGYVGGYSFETLWDNCAATPCNLEVIVEGTPLTPRQEMHGVPFAFSVPDNSIDDTKIDWGTGADQVSAVDVPYNNAVSGLSATDVKNAIDELEGLADGVADGSSNYQTLYWNGTQWTPSSDLTNNAGDVSMTGDLTVTGNDIYGNSTGDAGFYLHSRGNIRAHIDSDGSSSDQTFAVTHDAGGAIVFEVTEGGSFTAQGNGNINGNLMLTGASRNLDFDAGTGNITSPTGIDIVIDDDDATGAGYSSHFYVKHDVAGTSLLHVNEYGDLDVTRMLNLAPQTAEPTGSEGDIYADDAGYLRYYNGSGWLNILTEATGMGNPMTNQGDLIYYSASANPDNLAIGTPGTFLKSVAGYPSWQSLAATDIGAGANNTVLITNGSGTVGWGTVNSTMITDGTIVVGDLNAASFSGWDQNESDDWTTSDFSSADITNWNTAYNERYYWDGGAHGVLVPATGRSSLGLGALAVLNAVSGGAGGTITDNTIVTADISSINAEKINPGTFGGAAAYTFPANLNLNGTVLTLDTDNTGSAGNTVQVIANQGTESDGLIQYDAGDNRWEYSNDGGTNWFAFGTYSGMITNVEGTAPIYVTASSGSRNVHLDWSAENFDVVSDALVIKFEGVNSDEILNGTIVNLDVNASAAIAWSKLATGSINQVAITSGGGVLTTEAQLAISRGGTGISSAPTAAGQYLRSTGAGTWGVNTIQAGDLPSLSGTYVPYSGATANVDLNNHDMTLGTGDLTCEIVHANKVDPTVKIDGQLFVTWMAENVGFWIDIISEGQLNNGKYEVDLNAQPAGSDLWLFWRTVAEGTVIPFVTPQDRAYLCARMEGSKLIVELLDGDASARFSFRLSGKRLDEAAKSSIEINRPEEDTDHFIDLDKYDRFGNLK